MTKSLEQIQQENRKFILEAIHGCSYEEALKKELNVGCKIIVPARVKNYVYTITDEDDFKIGRDQIIEIIGKPLTLSRVLLALPSELYYYTSGNLLYLSKPNQDPKEQITWDLTKETLEEQSEETQRVINQLLTEE